MAYIKRNYENITKTNYKNNVERSKDTVFDISIAAIFMLFAVFVIIRKAFFIRNDECNQYVNRHEEKESIKNELYRKRCMPHYFDRMIF